MLFCSRLTLCSQTLSPCQRFCPRAPSRQNRSYGNIEFLRFHKEYLTYIPITPGVSIPYYIPETSIVNGFLNNFMMPFRQRFAILVRNGGEGELCLDA
jgi:hypothetical protein